MSNRFDVVLSGGNIVFDIEDSAVFAGSITGTGRLVKRGSGSLALAQSPNITGELWLEKGSIAGDGVAITVSDEFRVAAGASLNVDIVLSGGTLIFDVTTPASYSGQITGNGNVIKRGGGELAFSGEAVFAGEFRLEQGSLGGNITVGETTTLKVTRGTIAASVSLDEGRVVFAESRVANHTGTISGTGEAIIPSGVSLTFVGQGLSVEGGVVLKVRGDMVVKDNAQLAMNVLLSGGRLIFSIDNTSTSLYSGEITGGGTVIKQGEGVLDFEGAANFNGDFDVNNGRLGGSVLVGGDTFLNVYSALLETVALGGGVTFMEAYSGLSANVVLDGGRLAFFSGGYYEGVVSGSGAVSVLSISPLVLTGQFDFSGLTTVAKDTLVVKDGAAITSDVALVTGGSLVFSLEGGYSYEGLIVGGGTVIKQGEGALTLSSRSTFLGIVSIEGGSLEVLKEAAFDAPPPFVSATFTPTTLTVNFSQTPAVYSDYTIFSAETDQFYPNDSLILTGTTASGDYYSTKSRVVIVP